MKFYFNNTRINDDYIVEFKYQANIFNQVFAFGTVCKQVSLTVDKDAFNNISQVSNVVICDEDDTILFDMFVDSVDTVDDNYYELSLLDRMVFANVDSDLDTLFSDEQVDDEGKQYITIRQIVDHIAERLTVNTCAALPFDDRKVYEYDSTVSLRNYLSYIAEIHAGIFLIDGVRLKLKRFENTGITTEDYEDVAIGSKFEYSKVVYDNGLVSWSAGDDTAMTFQVDETNPFVIETDIAYIQEQLADLQFYNLQSNNYEVPVCDVGDIVTFGDFATIIQPEWNWNLGWAGSQTLQISNDTQQSTSVIGESTAIKSIKTIINRQDGRIDIIAEEISDYDTRISTLTTAVEGITGFVYDQIGTVVKIKSDGVYIYGIDGFDEDDNPIISENAYTKTTNNGYQVIVDGTSVSEMYKLGFRTGEWMLAQDNNTFDIFHRRSN